MLTIDQIEPHIQHEFGRLLGSGFHSVAPRRWVRSEKLPIRELFSLSLLKGGRYSPRWGFSCALVPAFRANEFRRQSTEKNAGMDLVIDPVDESGNVPPEAFRFIFGVETQVPLQEIRRCAERFVQEALADFDRVQSLADFCKFFQQRSTLHYERFQFHNYTQHNLVAGFLRLWKGQQEDGNRLIRKFCEDADADFNDRILQECIQNAGQVNLNSSF